MKSSVKNIRSQRSIERLKLKREGVLRNYMIGGDGIPRSAIYYSVLDSEWQEIKTHLENKITVKIQQYYE